MTCSNIPVYFWVYRGVLKHTNIKTLVCFKTYLHKWLKYADMLLNLSITVTQLYPDSNSNSSFQTPGLNAQESS